MALETEEEDIMVVEVTCGPEDGSTFEPLSRKWTFTHEKWDEPDLDRTGLLASMNGAAYGYAALLMLQPDKIRWVKTDWRFTSDPRFPSQGD